jgi:hypothetical protein
VPEPPRPTLRREHWRRIVDPPGLPEGYLAWFHPVIIFYIEPADFEPARWRTISPDLTEILVVRQRDGLHAFLERIAGPWSLRASTDLDTAMRRDVRGFITELNASPDTPDLDPSLALHDDDSDAVTREKILEAERRYRESGRKPWDQLGISRPTYYRRLDKVGLRR